MKNIYISLILCLAFSFLNAQNNSDLQILKQSSQIIFNNSVAKTDINTLFEATKIVPEIAPVVDLLTNKMYDKNLQKRISAQIAIKKQIGKLTNKKGFDYINVLYNLASDYSNLTDYENAQKLYEEALEVLNAEVNSETKTQWKYIIKFAKILNTDFGSSKDDIILLEDITIETIKYLNSHPKDKNDEIILLCINTLRGVDILQIPLERWKDFYSRGKELAIKNYGSHNENILNFQSVYAAILTNENNFKEAKKVINQTIKESENLFGKENLVKSYALQALSYVQWFEGDMQMAISYMEQSITMLSNIFDEGNINVLTLKRELALALLNTGKNGVEKAGKLTEEILEQSEKKYSKVSTQYVNALTYQIDYYKFTENIAAQRETLKKAHNLAKELAKTNKLDAGTILNNLFDYYQDMNSFDEAIAISDEAMAVLKNTPKGEIEYVNSLINKNFIYQLSENFNEAEKCLNEAITILKNSNKQQLYADVLSCLGMVYSHQKKKKEAEKTYNQAYQIYKKNGFENRESFGSLLVNYGDALVQNEKYKLAQEKFEEAIKFAIEIESNFLLGNCYKNYSYLFYIQNDLTTAMEYLNNAEMCFIKCGDNGITQRAEVLNDKSDIYRDLGQYNEAKKALTEVRNITDKIKGKTSYDYFHSLVDLYKLAKQIGNLVDMHNYFLDIRKAFNEQQQLSNKDINQMLRIKNLTFPIIVDHVIAMQELDINISIRLELEEWLLTLKTELDDRNIQSNHVSKLLGDYYYYILEDDDKALKYYREEIEGIDKNSLVYAAGLHRLSLVYATKGDYEMSAFYEKQCIDLRKQLLNDKNIDLSFPLINLSFCYYNTKKYPQAFQAAKERFEILQPNINSLFSTMNENDRLALSDNYKTHARDIYNLLPVYPQDEVTQTAYDAALYYKGLLLRSSNSIRQAIYASKNNDLINDYEQLIKMRKQLQSKINIFTNRVNSQDTIRYIEIRQLYEKADSLDWYLTQNSVAYRNAEETKTPKWTEIRNNLKDSEVAIEFIISFDTVDYCYCQYGALILKKDAKAPVYVQLFKEKQLKNIMNELAEKHKGKGYTDEDFLFCRDFYRNELGYHRGKEVYDLIWQPIAEKLSPTDTTIYYSPVGILYNIAFSALQNEDKKPLFDLYNFRLVSSTGSIVSQSNAIPKILDAQIYGGIKYDAVKQRGENENWVYLDGTKIESAVVDSIFKQYNITSDFYTDLSATEEIFRKNNANGSASLLFFATHGYYAAEGMEKNPEYRTFYRQFSENLTPMKRGGLILSDANPVWHREDTTRPDNNNGILLAEEIAEINLSNTDLAVLSACETGLGNVSETEGVFGLQRGLRLSGVKSIVMSLWRVDDKAGKEFMIEFFTQLLSGKEKHEAFRTTQQTLRNKHPKDPYRWAVFVMLD